jgi:hypothetical protein
MRKQTAQPSATVQPLFEEAPCRNPPWICRYLSQVWVRPLLASSLCLTVAEIVSILSTDYFTELGRTDFLFTVPIPWLLAFIFVPSFNRFFLAPALEEFATRIDTDGYRFSRFFCLCFESLGYIVIIYCPIQIVLAGAGVVEIPGG